MAVGYSTAVGGYSYGFDFEAFLINTDATLDNMSVEDLYTAIKRAQSSEAGMPEDVIAFAEGLSTLGSGVQTFITVKLQGDWEVNTLKTSGKFQVQGGNLIKANGLDPFLDNPLITYINFLSQAGVKTTVETGISGVIPQDLVDFKDAVFNELVESTETFRDQIRLIRAEAAGKVSVVGNDVKFRDAADTKDRIDATTDANGQRTSVTTDAT
jgi:hypothetical protein